MLPIQNENRPQTPPYVARAIIAANILAFIWQLSVGLKYLVVRFGFVAGKLSHGDLSQVVHAFAAMFLHGGFLHLLGNLWFFRLFGGNVEDEMGHARFLFFYVACGLAGSAAQFFADPASLLPAIGASGAISGVLGAYMIKYPMAPIRVWAGVLWLFTPLEIPALAFLIFWAGTQLLLGVAHLGTDTRDGGVAYWAHVGGFFTGVVLICFLAKPGRRWLPGEW